MFLSRLWAEKQQRMSGIFQGALLFKASTEERGGTFRAVPATRHHDTSTIPPAAGTALHLAMETPPRLFPEMHKAPKIPP